ncbi:MAG: formyltetrahydrofolate deformylase [Pseudomonadota bacterium]
MPERYILRCVAADRIGILAGVMGVLAAQELNVVESHDFGDPESGVFFIRAAFEAPTGFQGSDFNAAFESVAQDFWMSWTLRRAAEKPRVLVMVSKADHCLNDLLYRHRRDRLGADIVAIVSNHDDARWLAERHGVAFHHVPVTPETKPAAEQRLLDILEAADAEFVVLARYMQILSPELTDALSGRCINIHHSFLPSFKGAKPYHQAHKRGVKLIGATAHYVTSDLDEGPIIAQDVAPVDHRMTPQDFVALGRDIEARVLVRAVTDHAEGRVFLNGARTVVFE